MPRHSCPRLFALSAAIVAALGAGGAARAQDAPDEVVVFGRASRLLGTAEAASEGTVAGADLLVRPMLKVAELLEVVPGMVAVQHSGSGKANQYFLRGFNLDHGTDFTTVVDGMPWNLRSHGHGQGYLDVNGLLPEAVDRIDYRKGPYRADSGDFAMAGGSYISTIDRLDAPFGSLESGEFGWARLAGGGSVDTANGTLTGIAEWKTYDGPWELDEGLEHFAGWGKYLRETRFGSLELSVWGYDAHWRPTEQLPERAIGTPYCADEFCALDPTARGDTKRWIMTAQLDGADWSASTYLQYYDWYMQSNPTYDLQINQFDRRWTTGGRYDRYFMPTAGVDVAVGVELRHDDVGNVGLDEYEHGQFVSNISRNSIRETSLGVYAETTWSATDKLRLFGGLRGDYFDFSVTARSPASFAGSASDTRVSPKVGLAFAASDRVELYANWGRGFHSNDARGVVNSDDPVPGLAPGEGYEAGARFDVGAVKITTAYWWLNLDSELIFVGDSNSVEPKGGSRRDGYELTFFYRPVPWLGIDGVYTGSNARYTDISDGEYIEGSVEHAGQLGISAVKGNWEGSMRLRYLGPYALLPDNSQRAGSETSVNLRGAYSFGRTTLYAELLNVFDADGKDIVYYYGAYVAGLDDAAIAALPDPEFNADFVDANLCGADFNCRMSRAEEPRTLRVGVKIKF